MTDTGTPPPDGSVTLTQDEYNALLKGQREGMAIQAGMDLENPVSELVLEQHWTPEITVDDMKVLVETYNVAVPVAETESSASPDPEPKVEERTGPEGSEAAGDIRSVLSAGTSVPGTTIQLDPDREAKSTYDQSVEQGLSREDSRIAAMDTLFKTSGGVHAMSRINERKRDEEQVASILASQEAALGAGNV